MIDWRKQLKQVASVLGGDRHKGEQDSAPGQIAVVTEFFREVVHPAFEDIVAELTTYGFPVAVSAQELSASISVTIGNQREFRCEVVGRTYRKMDVAFPALPRGKSDFIARIEVSFPDSSHLYSLEELKPPALQRLFVHEFELWANW